MSCNDVRSILEDYVDGLVIAPIAEQVRDHLARCESCRIEVDASRAASLAMSDWGDLEPPADCFERILAQVEALPPEALDSAPPPQQQQPRLRLLRGASAWWAATAAVALMAFFFGVEVTDSFEPIAPMDLAGPGFALAVSGPRPLSRERVVEPVDEDDFIDHDGVRKRIRVVPTFDDGEFGSGGGLPLANPVPADFDPRQTPR